MIHILVLILKIIGWILLILLAILFLLILIVLFHPVKYRFCAEGKNTLDSLNADGKISWLFHLISASIHYEHGELNWNLRLAWKEFNGADENHEDDRGRRQQVKESARHEEKKVPKKTDDKKTEEKNTVKKEPVKVEEKPAENEKIKTEEKSETAEVTKTVQKIEKAEKPEECGKSESSSEVVKTRERKQHERWNISSLYQKIRSVFLSLFEKIKYTFQKLCATIKKAEKKKEFLTTFVTYEKHKRAFEKAKKELRRLLRFLKPRKLQTDLTFGFSDPSWTGYVLAFLGSIYGLIGEYVQIQPDFEERRLEGNVYVEGKIRAIYFVIPAWNLFWDKDVKITYKHIRKYM